MDAELVKQLLTAGPMGLVLVLSLWVYKDQKTSTERREKEQEERYQRLATDLKEIVVSNTAALTRLATLIEISSRNSNGRH